MDKGFMSSKDIAAHLGLSYQHTRQRLVYSEGFPQPYRFGRSVRWKRADVDKWAEKHYAPATQ